MSSYRYSIFGDVVIDRAWCDEHLDTCYQAHNRSTGRTTCIKDLTAYKHNLEQSGYYYAGRHSGMYIYNRRQPSAPLMEPDPEPITFDDLIIQMHDEEIF